MNSFVVLIDMDLVDVDDDNRVFLASIAEQLEHSALDDASPAFFTLECKQLMVGIAQRYRRAATEIEELRRERGVSRADVRSTALRSVALADALGPLLDEARTVTALADKLETRIGSVLVAVGARS